MFNLNTCRYNIAAGPSDNDCTYSNSLNITIYVAFLGQLLYSSSQVMYLLTKILSSCLSNCALVVFNDFFLVTITSLFGFVLARITANDNEEHCAFFRD